MMSLYIDNFIIITKYQNLVKQIKIYDGKTI